MGKESVAMIYESEIDKSRRENSDLYEEIVKAGIQHDKDTDSVNEQIKRAIKAVEDEIRLREEGVKNRRELNDLNLTQVQKIDELYKKLRKSNQEVEKLKERLDLLTESYKGQVSENKLKDDQIEFIEKKFSGIKKQREDLIRQNNLLIEEKADLLDEKLNLKDTSTRLKEELSNSRKEAEASQKENSLLVVDNDRLNQNNQRLKKQIKNLQKELADTKEKAKEVQKDYEELDCDQRALLTKNAELKKRLGQKIESISDNQTILSSESLPDSGVFENEPQQEVFKLKKKISVLKPSRIPRLIK